MKNIVCFDDWVIDIDAPFGSGASKKYWLVNYKTNQRGIFKYPKITSGGTVTGEYWAESLAYEIACVLGIPCAKTEMGTFSGSVGSMSYMLLNKNETLVEGISYLEKEYPDYNPDKFVDITTGTWYSFQMILHSIKGTGLWKEFLGIPVFDALIGNSDRHHSNWGIVINEETQQLRLSPLYDNGSSLCAIVNEAKINLADKSWFNALVDTRSRSIIRIENAKREPTHFKVMAFLSNEYPESVEYVNRIKDRLTNGRITELLNDYPDSIISPQMKRLLFSFITKRRDRIIDIFSWR